MRGALRSARAALRTLRLAGAARRDDLWRLHLRSAGVRCGARSRRLRFPWDRLIAAFKFHGALDLAPVLAEAIVEAHGEVQGGEAPPLVVPVPLSVARLRERGYNQAWSIARRVARRLGIRADAAGAASG